jgi:hypothetical protein
MAFSSVSFKAPYLVEAMSGFKDFDDDNEAKTNPSMEPVDQVKNKTANADIFQMESQMNSDRQQLARNVEFDLNLSDDDDNIGDVGEVAYEDDDAFYAENSRYRKVIGGNVEYYSFNSGWFCIFATRKHYVW